MTRYDTIRNDTIRYDTKRYETIQYEAIRSDTIRYNIIQYNTIRLYSTLKLYAQYYTTLYAVCWYMHDTILYYSVCTSSCTHHAALALPRHSPTARW